MEPAFWQERWRENRIAFHELQPNPMLTKTIGALQLEAGSRMFVPLSGKSVDLDWLLSQGMRVAGAELNQGAVEEVFGRLNVEPKVTLVGDLHRYDAGDLVLYAGDFFELSKAELGPIDAIYDRAALVAMPQSMRGDYANHLMQVSAKAPQLLVAFDYDQSQMDGPPFSVPEATIRDHYAADYTIVQLSDRAIEGHLAQRCKGREQTWLLSPKT